MRSSASPSRLSAPAFPLRVAAVDMGSNAIRFIAAEHTSETDSTRIDSERVPLRLGTEAFGAGELSDDTLRAVLEALRGFRHRMDALGVVRYRAVATSAVRQSRNGALLVERAWEEAGIRLEIVSGREEAGLVWRSVRERMPPAERARPMADLGGGSVEVSLVEDGRVTWSESEPLGTVRLLSELPRDADPQTWIRDRLGELVERVRSRTRHLQRTGEMIAVGGNIEAIAALVNAPGGRNGVRTLTLTRLREVRVRLARLSYQERIDDLGLREDRADVIHPAAMVYETLAEAVGAETLLVPDVGVKEGVLLAQVDTELARRGAPATRVAFLSDIHANVLALRAGLEAAERYGAGRVVVAGDIVGDGPHPVETVKLLEAYGVTAIRGNVDRKVLALDASRGTLHETADKGGQKANRAWTALQLRDAEEERGWLQELPAERRLDVEGTEVLVVHGSPHGDTDYVYPSLTPEGLASKLEALDGRRPDVLVCGHSHVPFAREVDGVWVLNCGSVGRPADGDRRGSLILADFDGDEVSAEVVRFEYPVGALVSDLEARAVPGVGPEEYRHGVKR